MSKLLSHRWFGLLAVLPFAACASQQATWSSHQDDEARKRPPPVASSQTAIVPREPYSSSKAPSEKGIVDAYIAAHPDLTADQVLAAIPKRQYVEKISFDPSTAAYYKEVANAMQLTDQERDLLRKNGFVSVDHRRHMSMASMYFDIYIRDLPVLITTDSILHALHRSYDETLKTLEVRLFTGMLDRLLASTHEKLEKEAAGVTDPKVLESVRDLDLYLTVARNLLAGAGAPPDEEQPRYQPSPKPAQPTSKFGQDKQVQAILARVVSLEMETPEHPTSIYGGQRAIDWSQFKPRGHYTETAQLKYYFRMMMWLGRADLGWNLTTPDENSGLVSDAARERRNAAMLSLILGQTGQMPRLQAMWNIIDFLIGRGDSLSADALLPVLEQIQIKQIADLGNAEATQRLESVIKQLGLGQQSIRSQVLSSDPKNPKKTPPPAIFQVFGQRFVVDSFVLSQVVYDSIMYGGKKQERYIPLPIDVFAALGNDEAVRLLESELRRWNYGSNLMATRAVVDSYTPKMWNASVYNTWLDALRIVDDPFPANSKAPQAMRTLAWQHKELETQLASWAELRHDTILYVKQSYSSVTMCEYPAGYVEPYPAFYERLGALGRQTAHLLGAADVSDVDPARTEENAALRQSMVTFWDGFGATMDQLQTLAKKELAAQPFTSDELAFIKKTIDIRGGGSGPPRYDGWYPKLIFGGDPTKWNPTVADVHTDPTTGQVVQVGVGDITFLVAAIDNEGDKMVYVGPMSSYFEFLMPPSKRMTDEEWREKVQEFVLPARPSWSLSVHPSRTAPALTRSLGPPPSRSYDD